jgi:hypothetical protein
MTRRDFLSAVRNREHDRFYSVTCEGAVTAWRLSSIFSDDRDCRPYSHNGDQGRGLESADMLHLDLLDVR